MKYIFTLLFASFQLFCVTNVLAQIPENLPAADTEKVSALLQNFGDNIASGNAKEILQLLSPSASSTLRAQIENNIENKPISFDSHFDTVTYDENLHRLTLTGTFNAEYKGVTSWSYSGLSHTLVLQKEGDNWYVLESDIIEKFSAKGVLRILLPFLLIGLLVSIFWLWMFIDACLHSFNNNKNKKVLWLVCFFIFNIFTAIVYFFTVHKTPKNTVPPVVLS